ncbi:MAG: hypothetical protein HY721_15100 [Planctomycetes bacterium]|nr:hypothetical protein [Planctomycetota bacterium]
MSPGELEVGRTHIQGGRNESNEREAAMKRMLTSVAVAVVVLAVWVGRGGQSGGQGAGESPCAAKPELYSADANGDGVLDLSDAVRILGYLFLGNEPPLCLAATPNPPRICELCDERFAAAVHTHSGVDVSCAAGSGNVCDELNELKQRVAELEALTRDMSIVEGDARVPGRTVLFTGVNVQIVTGLGRTETTNGVGNLIVGYQEFRGQAEGPPTEEGVNTRTGSHNIVVGARHNYSSSSGLLVGAESSLIGPGCAILGGHGSRVLGSHSVIVGGAGSCTHGSGSVIVAGENNTTNGGASAIIGGVGNRTTGAWSVQCGGNNREVQSNSVCQAGSCPPCAP